MNLDTSYGAPQFPSVLGSIAPSTPQAMDSAVQALQAHKSAWVQLSIHERIALLDKLIDDFSAITPRWAAACLTAKGLTDDSPFAGEEWLAGVWPVLRYLRLLRLALADIKAYGRPRVPGPVATRSNGQVTARVFPQSAYDRLFFPGVTAELWMQPGVTREALPQTQALRYQNRQHEGKVALVLGAGNVASIGPIDILYKMFQEDQVVICKLNPVNVYLGPLLEEAFHTLIESGFLRTAYGGAEEGEYLCHHPGIDEIHITGSDKTFDAIVFGKGPNGATRKAKNQPILTKPITGELGNVSPVIIVPGPWSKHDVAYQAEHLVSTLTNNAGFNCNATRVIIQPYAWEHRKHLLQQIRSVLSRVPLRTAYYPGGKERYHLFTQSHPHAERFGTPSSEQLPWTFIPDLDAQHRDDICFTTEAFCGLFAETPLRAISTREYLEQAVDLCNNQLWGTLNATILVHPKSLKDPAVAEALDRAVANLRYGTIGINYWAAANFAFGVTPWGAYPGHTINDVQSGIGMVHNTLMFEHPQKTVVRGPFHSFPIPPWFVLRGKTASKVFPMFTKFEAQPSPWKALSIVLATLRG